MADRVRAKRADAALNRERILDAARSAFVDPEADVSMAELARRSGVGSGTLYRNFPTRRELLEALYRDEVDAVCAAASTVAGDDEADRLTAWLHRFFDFVASKRPVAVELLDHTDRTDAVFDTGRKRVVTAGEPLLEAARRAGLVETGLSLDQVLDMVVAVAKISPDPAYVRPILEAALAGLRRGATGPAGRPSHPRDVAPPPRRRPPRQR